VTGGCTKAGAAGGCTGAGCVGGGTEAGGVGGSGDGADAGTWFVFGAISPTNLWPHLMQNFVECELGVPHSEHLAWRCSPQDSQNLVSSEFS